MLPRRRSRVALVLHRNSGNGVKYSGMDYQHIEPPNPQSVNWLGLRQIRCDV